MAISVEWAIVVAATSFLELAGAVGPRLPF
jgi:hypothetical protein